MLQLDLILTRGEPDNIIGVLHVKNLIKALREHAGNLTGADILAICSKPWFIPETTNLRDQLLAFRSKRQHFAFVVDEYGGIDGLVTIEDLVETIVGDIADEHDEVNAPRMVERPDGSLDLDARTPVEEFEARMGQVLTDEERGADIDTMGGLVFTLAGRVPARGELVSHVSGLEFRVLDSDSRRIRKLRVRRPLPGGKAAAE